MLCFVCFVNHVFVTANVECAVCGLKVSGKNWSKHSMDEHYNLAWIKGNKPIVRILKKIKLYLTLTKDMEEIHGGK